MKNRHGDLTNHLFAQLERLSDEDLSGDELEQELKRSEAVVSVSDAIVSNSNLQLKAAKLFADHGAPILDHLPQIGGPKNET